jgi:hypothetical protein
MSGCITLGLEKIVTKNANVSLRRKTTTRVLNSKPMRVLDFIVMF